MAEDRRAAIDLEALENKTLDSLSAADFLTALSGAGAIGAQAIRFWPEKKKYELYLEPENLGKVTVGGIFTRVREKKKIELEKDVRTEYVHKQPGPELDWLNVEDLVTNPAFRQAVTTIAREVAGQLSRR